MNYINIYDSLIKNAKRCEPQRIANRVNKTHYYERHHIIPRFDNGTDEQPNLVYLTFREHFLAHMLLYKHYKKNGGKKYAAFNSLQIMMANVGEKYITAGMSRIYNNTKCNYWDTYSPSMHPMWGRAHSLEVREKLRELKKGKLCARDVSTGEVIGFIDKNHPNLLDGTWVHATTGRKNTKEQTIRQSIEKSGLRNGNASQITTDEILAHVAAYHSIADKFTDGGWKKYRKDNKIRYGIKFRFGKTSDFYIAVRRYFRERGMTFNYDRYDRSDNTKYRSKTKHCWVTDPVTHQLHSIPTTLLSDYISRGYIKGMKRYD